MTKPELPKQCRTCQGNMQAVETTVLQCFAGTKNPRTTKYRYACDNDLSHRQLIVLDTPVTNYRVVIPADVYDETREKRK